MYQFVNCSIDIHHLFQNAAKILEIPFTFREKKTIKQSQIEYKNIQYRTCFYKKQYATFLDTFVGPKK
jgi:hypothetical protein